MALELSDLSEEEARPFGFLAGGLLNIFEPDDVEVTASQMPNNSAAGLLLIEDTWAIPLKASPLECRCCSQGWRSGGSRSGTVDRGRNRSGNCREEPGSNQSCRIEGERVC